MISEFLFCIAFTISFFLHEKYRIKDEQTADLVLSTYLKKMWHRYKGGVQLVVFAYIFYTTFQRSFSWFYATGVTLVCASFFWLFHDGLLNTYLFKREWWWVGTTATIDRKLGRTFISIAKILCLITGTTLIMLWKIFY